MSQPSDPRTLGLLTPARLPTFVRIDAPAEVADLVRWFWIPEWDLAPGRSIRQQLIAFPATNVVIEPPTVVLSGPTTKGSFRDLTGRGWAVGALLQPAAVPTLAPDPGDRHDRLVAVDRVDLHDLVVAAWTSESDRARRHRAVVLAFSGWLLDQVPQTTDDGRLANRMAHLIESDSAIVRIEQVAEALHVSVRTLQRLARTHVGLSPAAMIRRRRLQEAAELVRTDRSSDLTEIAARLGYADHAHLTREFRTQLGFTPTAYRSGML